MTAPIDIGADPARDLARQELARTVYSQSRASLVERFVAWIQEQLGDLLRAADTASPGGVWGLAVLVVLAVVVIVLVRRRFGRPERAAALHSPVFDAVVRTAAEHRRAADAHAAAEEYDDAVRERMRAVVRDLEERTVLEVRSGRTAGEAAREAGRVLSSVADGLTDAARIFDETVYGGRAADADAAARMRAVDEEVRAVRVVAAAGP